MSEIKKRRKNYPGDERVPGTKDYSMILGNLIHYKHQLTQETNDQKVAELMLKVSVKLKELGFKGESEIVKKKVGRRKAGKFQNITPKKQQEAVEIALNCWEAGTSRNDKAKENAKKEAKRVLKRGSASEQISMA